MKVEEIVKEFEIWASSEDMDITKATDKPVTYFSGNTSAAWLAWGFQAARFQIDQQPNNTEKKDG